MTPHDKLQVMTSLSLPSACPAGQKKIVGNFSPQYKIDFSTMFRLKPSFGSAKVAIILQTKKKKNFF